MSIKLSDYDPALKQGANIDIAIDLTDIVDVNGNEVIEIDGITSAVNYIRVGNSATTLAPEFSAQGDDTNIDFQLSEKGVGRVIIGSYGTATASAGGTCTINAQRGLITSASLTTGSAVAVTFDITDSRIASTDLVIANVVLGSSTTGQPVISEVSPGSGSCTIKVYNASVTAALNGTIKINFIVL